MSKKLCGVCGNPTEYGYEPLKLLPEKFNVFMEKQSKGMLNILEKPAQTKDGQVLCKDCRNRWAKLKDVRVDHWNKFTCDQIREALEKGPVVVNEISRGKRMNMKNIDSTRKALTFSERQMSKDVDLAELEREIQNFFRQKGKTNEDFMAVLDHEGAREFWNVDYCVVIEKQSDHVKLKFGRVSAVETAGSSVGYAFLTGGIALLGGAGLAAIRKKMEADFWKHINQRFPATQSVSNPQIQEDIPAKIKQLSELHQQGILTDEEFEKKKTELLERL